MINTDNYIRWERVDSVTQTTAGILAKLASSTSLRPSRSASTHLPHLLIFKWNKTRNECS